MEHRWGKRVTVDIPLRLTGARTYMVGSGQLANLSVSGGFIITGFRVHTLARIDVLLKPGRKPEPEASAIAAYVARQYKDGIGVEWCEFAPPCVADLLRDISVRPFARGNRPNHDLSQRQSHVAVPLLKHFG